MSNHDIIQKSLILDDMQYARAPRLAIAHRLSKLGAEVVELAAQHLNEMGNSVRVTVRVEAWRFDRTQEQTISGRLAQMLFDEYGRSILGPPPQGDDVALARYIVDSEELLKSLYDKIRKRIKEIV